MGNTKARQVAFMGLLLGLALALSAAESMLPPLPVPGMPPVKPGLSNMVTMFCLYVLGIPAAWGLAVLKSFFVFFTRGVMAGCLSLAGGVLSILIMALVRFASTKKASIVFTSVCGAAFHNLGQMAASCFFLKSTYVFVYLPVFIIAGVVMGAVTGSCFHLLLPHLRRIYPGGS